MGKFDDVNAAWTEVDAATTALGTRVQKLIDEINQTTGAGLDGPQTEAVLARLATLRDTLEGMGKNPDEPIPEPLPETPIPGVNQ